ncbi:hypothetical protein PSQ20_00130 [Curvibacter sp. RS43]|uniref:hypothetical protein n=1 Tax=Curvibacter microcysteis TaxID=3026419 RepID=UPI00235EDE6A|nr:hypothetical protein [Curvibacter sp. RS43]MDD0808730.1 hypothetical protein [Curvibacter sp. RS43]
MFYRPIKLIIFSVILISFAATIIISQVGIFGCSPKLSTAPTALLAGHSSRQKIEDIRANFEALHVAYIYKQENNIAATEMRPQFYMATVIIPDFFLEETRGSLKLIFFNDFLYSTTFTPSNSERLNKTFQKVTGQSATADKCIHIEVSTKVCVHTSGVLRGFITADDECLEREINNWIAKWS